MSEGARVEQQEGGDENPPGGVPESRRDPEGQAAYRAISALRAQGHLFVVVAVVYPPAGRPEPTA